MRTKTEINTKPGAIQEVFRENENLYGLMGILTGFSLSILELKDGNDYYNFANTSKFGSAEIILGDNINIPVDTSESSVYFAVHSAENVIGAHPGHEVAFAGFDHNTLPMDASSDPFIYSNFAIPAYSEAVNLHAADITLS